MTESPPTTLLESVPHSFVAGPEWLRALRNRAAASLQDLGLPNKKTEAWRFTSVRSIADATFHRRPASIDLVPTTPAGLEVRSLREVLRNDPESLEGRLGGGAEAPFFAALNTALFEDGVWVHVPAGARVDRPLRIIHPSAPSSEASVRYPRVLVTAEEGSELTLIEVYAGKDPQQLSNGVVEVDLSPNSRVHHIRIHEDPGMQIARVSVSQAASSVYRSTVLTLGGSLLRLDIHARLRGQGAECQLNGAYLVDGQDHVDHHTLVEHESSHCQSHQTYRGIAAERGTAVFDGIVVVHRDAQKTEAHQENRNLLLSDTATVHTKPHLEIDADDVICSHGATVGSLDEDQLFYLRARGIPEDVGRAVLTNAFLQEIMEGVGDEATRLEMKEAVLDRIPHGDAVRGIS